MFFWKDPPQTEGRRHMDPRIKTSPVCDVEATGVVHAEVVSDVSLLHKRTKTLSMRPHCVHTASPMALSTPLALGPPRTSSWSSWMAVSSCWRRSRTAICSSRWPRHKVAPGALSTLLLAAAADSWCFSTSSEMIRRLQPPLVHVDRRHFHLQH